MKSGYWLLPTLADHHGCCRLEVRHLRSSKPSRDLQVLHHHPDCVEVAALDGVLQRGEVVVDVHQVDVGPVIHQQPHHLTPPIDGCDLQQCPAVLGHSVRVNSLNTNIFIFTPTLNTQH